MSIFITSAEGFIPQSGKIGFKFTHGKWTELLLTSYVHRHYSDGTNATIEPNAVAGIILSYYVIDFNATYRLNKTISLKTGLNNLTNNRCFTRRATAFLGLGIIPSDGINFHFTLGLRL